MKAQRQTSVTAHQRVVVEQWKRSSYVEDPSIKRYVAKEVAKELGVGYMVAKQLIEA